LAEWPEDKQRELVAGVTGLIYDFGFAVTQVRHGVIAAAIARSRADWLARGCCESMISAP